MITKIGNYFFYTKNIHLTPHQVDSMYDKGIRIDEETFQRARFVYHGWEINDKKGNYISWRYGH